MSTERLIMCEKVGKRRHSGDDNGDGEHPVKRRMAGAHDVDEEDFPDTSWLYNECPYCETHMQSLLTSRCQGEKVVLQMHAQYGVFSRSSRGDNVSKDEVKAFKDEFLQKVCSLRNERGGILIIHVTDKSSDKGQSLDDFDQKVCDELSRMVEDDTLYVENYDRCWYSKPINDTGDVEYLDFIIVTVKGSSSVSTKDFNTLVTWDGSKERPKAREISRLLWRTSLQFCGPSDRVLPPFVEGEKVDLCESRDIQLKRLYDKDLEKDLQENISLQEKSLASRIVFRLIEKLHLLEYITLFSKLRMGGSFFCGIEEEKVRLPSISSALESKGKASRKKKRRKGSKGVEKVNESTLTDKSLTNCNQISDKNDKISNQSLINEGGDNLHKSETKQTSLNTSPMEPYHSPDNRRSITGHNNMDSTDDNNINKEVLDVASVVDNVTCLFTDKDTAGDASVDSVAHSDGKFHKTAHNIVRGLQLTENDRVELENELKTSIQKNMQWLRSDGTSLTNEEILQEVCVKFHSTSENGEMVVLEVCVRNVFSGIVFYKSYGPDSFVLTGLSEDRPRVALMSPGRWIVLLRKAMECDNCDQPIWRLVEDDV